MVRIFPDYERPRHNHHYHPRAHEWQHYQAMPKVNVEEGKEPKVNVSLASLLPLVCRQAHPNHSVSPLSQDISYPFNLVLLDMVFIFVAISLLRVLLKPLRQPRVVAQILGGLIIGPSFLGRNPKFKASVLTEDAVYVLQNIGLIGFMYFIFLSAVRMDLTVIKNAGRKYVWITLIGICVPFTIITSIGFLLRDSMDKEFAKPSNIILVSGTLTITNFGVLHPILKELNLLSSEIGRVGLCVSVLGDLIGLPVVLAFEAAKQAETSASDAMWYMISLAVMIAFVIICLRPLMEKIIQRTPQGKTIDQDYTVGILLGVLGMGFLTDMFGMAVLNGPMWIGLVIPDGPPLAPILVERVETILEEILMPFSYAMVGLYTDVFSMTSGHANLGPLFAMSLAAYITKLITTFVTSLLFHVPFRDSLTLSLILSLRGQVELVLYIHWMDKRIVDSTCFTMMVLFTIAASGVASPLIAFIYDPARPYMSSRRRTIQHLPPGADFNIVVCIHDKESMTSLVNFLEVSLSSPNIQSNVYALHLVELDGRANPLLINHQTQNGSCSYPGYEGLHIALKAFRESRGSSFPIQEFTIVAPMRTIYQDICELALTKKVTFIIIPFHKDRTRCLGGVEFVRHGVQFVNNHVLSHAPCSVGIFVDNGHFGVNDILRQTAAGQSPHFAGENNIFVQSFSCAATYHFIMLFLGGADAREALLLSDQMVQNPNVRLTVMRFLSQGYQGDNEMERRIDDGVMTSFYVKHERNQRVAYKELVVRDGSQTAAAIKNMNDKDPCDLWIAGRTQGINPVLLMGLADWSENNELGVIGDYVISTDFKRTASVLVVQQQILRGQRTASGIIQKIRTGNMF